MEVFLDLAAVGLATDPSVDPSAAAPGCAGSAQGLGDGLEDRLGGLQQRFPLARPLLPQARVETHQQAFARKLRADDLGDLVRDQCLWTQRGRGTPIGRLLPQQLADVGGFQRRDPVQSGRLQFLTDPGRGDHAPVPHQSHPADPEPILDLGNLRPQRHRIPPVARKRLHRHRAALGGAQQSEHDLLLAFLAVPVVTECRQGATPSLQEAGGDVIKDQGGVAEMAVGQTLLDVSLAPEQPVEHAQQLIAGDRPQAQQGAEAGGGGIGGEMPCGGQLRARVEQTGQDGADGQIPLAPGVAMQQTHQPQSAQRAQPGCHVAVGQGSADGEGVFDALQRDAALEQGADPVDERFGHAGEVGAGLLADAFAFAPGLTDEEGGTAAAVGNGFEVIGHGNSIQGTTYGVKR